MLKIKYQIENLDGKLVDMEREFETEEDYITWRSTMIRGSTYKGKKFRIVKVV